jgi:hypothetical protein
MKKSDWIITIGTLAYSYLFYQQLAGINFLVFSILLCILLAVLNKDLWKEKKWLLYAGLAVATSFFVMWHNSDLAIWANVCSLLLLSANSVNRNSSVIFNGFYSMYSIAGSYVFMIINLVNRYESKPDDAQTPGKKGLNFLIGLAIFIIVLIFFFIYKNANPLFEKFTEKINLDFISWKWVLFTLLGFFIVYGLIKHQRITGLDRWESGFPVSLTNSGKKIVSFERQGGVFLFIILNSMLLFINVLDVIYLYVLKQLPEGITHAQFVHNGVGMIILSVVLGIAIILFLFRNAMNFDERNKLVKLLVTLWILQNAMMIVSTCVRNYIYVGEFSLTYKRIGVFVYLLLAMIGLFLTLYKIRFRMSNWFLVRTNAFCWYLFLCVSSFINWDKVVCEFNISRKAGQLERLDKKYLLGLSVESIPYLQALKDKKGFETDSIKVDIYRGPTASDAFSGINDVVMRYGNNKSQTDEKTYGLLKEIHAHDNWQSWNHRNASILSQLKDLNEAGEIKTLDLRNQELDSVGLLSIFSNVQKVDFTDCQGGEFSFLKNYSRLTSLRIKGVNINSLDKVPGSNSLKELKLEYNPITTLKGIARFPNLKKLDLSNTAITQLLMMPATSQIDSLDADHCMQLRDLRGLNNAKALSYLSLNEAPVFDSFPALPSLKCLMMEYSGENINKNLFLVPVLENLEELHLSGSSNLQLRNLIYFDQRAEQGTPRFPKLKILFAYSCNIENAAALSSYTGLEKLQLNNNKLKDNFFMAGFNNLKEVSLRSNYLTKLVFTENHKNLQKLTVSNNEYLEDLSTLNMLSNLRYLDVSGTRFTDPGILTCENSLEELDIRNCRAHTLSQLLRFKKLTTLHTGPLSEKDIEVLKTFKSLKVLYIGTSGTEKGLQELKKQLPGIPTIQYEPY